MIVTIENCRNIDRAEITIDCGKLNLKFAPNGTGKSSIAQALSAAVNSPEALARLIPFKWRQADVAALHPFSVSGLDHISSVAVFDERYVQSVVFQPDSIFPGSFDVFVRTPEFIEMEHKLEERLRTLVELADREDVVKLSSDLRAFLAGMLGGAGLSRDGNPGGGSPVVKALREGNTWEHEDSLLAPYKPILGPGPFKKWAHWHSQGGAFLSAMGGNCPYCGESVSHVKERIDAVAAAYPSAKVGNIEKVVGALAVVSEYASESVLAKLNEIVDSAQPISEQSKGYIGTVAQDAQLIINAIESARKISSYYDLSRANDLYSRLRICRIDIELMGSFKSEKCCRLAEELNDAVEAAASNLGELIGIVNRQKSLLAKNLLARQDEINAFLTSAGYPYSVQIQNIGPNQCSVRLVHSSSLEVADSREALSYGERNAFALIFFAYECMRKRPDLVILDDPVSSFDGQKRFAIINMLFLGGMGEVTLKNRTVLLLTHDYGTLFDVERTYKDALQPSAKSCVLTQADGCVKETVVGAADMIPVDSLYESLAKGSDSLVIRLVYARKVLELEEDKGDAYDVVSSLFHHRQPPARRDGALMTSAEVFNGIRSLESLVEEQIDYDELLEMINDPREMLEQFDAASSNYEKMQLARIATRSRTNDAVLKERMDDSVHVGNGFLYQLDPVKFELVPSELVERCREELLAML